MRKNAIGFTLIELMIAMTITLFVVGTYLRFFAHSVKIEASTNLKSNITVKGEHILDTLDNAIRLAGLGNTSTEFKAGTVITSADGIASPVAAGNVFADDFNFTFQSPYGGPVTKVLTAQGSLPACTITLQSSASLYADLTHILLINRDHIYLATKASMSGNTIVTSLLVPAAVGTSCGEVFPAGTLVTGPNRTYSLNTLNLCTGCEVNFTETLFGVTTMLFSYSKAEIPFFAMQFLVETGVTPNLIRTWVPSTTNGDIGDCGTAGDTLCSKIKAVRFGFVITAKGQREGTPATTSFNYCLFDSAYCFTAPVDTNKRYLAFSRTVYLRNIDSLKRNLLE